MTFSRSVGQRFLPRPNRVAKTSIIRVQTFDPRSLLAVVHQGRPLHISIMAHLLRGKQAGVQKDLSLGITPEFFALDDVCADDVAAQMR